MKKQFLILLSFLAFGATPLCAQLVVTPADSLLQCTPEWLVRHVLLDKDVKVSNVRFNGSQDVIDCNSIGIFETGDASTNLGIGEGLILATGNVSVAVGPNDTDSKYLPTTCDPYFDESLASLTLDPDSVYDMSVLEFDFDPWDTVVSFNYVFASEEYLEWVGTFYNDVFGFFVTGLNPDGGYYENQNMAIIPGTDETVSINSVYTQHNPEYYVDNTNGETIQYDGFTTVMTVRFKVVPVTTYHIKLGICDVGDTDWDSGVFLEAHSFSANPAYDMTIDGVPYMEIPEDHRFCSNRSIDFNTVTEWIYDDVVWYFGDGSSAQGRHVAHTYTADGDYEVVNVLRSPHRSTDSLFLTTTISTQSFFLSEEASVCQNEPYLWHGQLLSQSGAYVDTLSSVAGCDSIVTLYLDVYETYTIEIEETHCEEFEWNGQTYTASGIYEHYGQSIHGCDSLTVLNLTINHAYYSDLRGPQWVVASPEAYRYAVPDSLSVAPNALTWSCSNPDWSITPSADGYHCDLWATQIGQGELIARTGLECDSVFRLTVNATGYDVEENAMQRINVYPNPAQSQVTIEGPQMHRIRLVDSFGQSILDTAFTPLDAVTLDINALPQGIYVMRISTASGEKTYRLMVSH